MYSFSDLMGKLYPYCGDGQSVEDYIFTMVNQLMEAPSSEEAAHKVDVGKYNPFASMQADSIKRIYSGARNISAPNASIILGRLDKGRFWDYISRLTEDAQIGLCRALEELGIVATPQDVGMVCADAFEKVLIDCSKSALKETKYETADEFTSDAGSKYKMPGTPIAEVFIRDGKIHIGDIQIKVHEALLPPVEIASEEVIYADELLAAYADAEKAPAITRETLPDYPGKYQKNFIEQRKHFYNAESIRRSLRDVFSEEDMNQFEILKDDTYDGIYEVCFDEYEHGYARLISVLKAIPTINTSKSLLSHIPNWIGNSEKKGICHMLVNDGKIKWVMEDD